MAVKARDLRMHLKGKIDPVLLKFLENMAEDQGDMQKTLVELTSMMGMVVNQAEAFNMIAEGMQKKLIEMGKNFNFAEAADKGEIN